MKNMETEKEIVDLIVQTLGEGEEQYILGSWEKFAQKQTERRRLIFLYWGTGIAAGLLVGWLGFRLVFTGSYVSNTDPLNKDQIVSRVDETSEKNRSAEPLVIKQEPVIKAEKKELTQTPPDSHVKESVASREDIIISTENNSSIPENHIAVLKPDTDTLNGRSDTARVRPLYSKTDVTNIIKEEDQPGKIRPHKFRIGVNIAPGFASSNTSSSFNYSGGVNADYELSKRFRISTGVQVEHQNITSENTTAASWMPGEKTQAMLVDLDIPLNITWKFLIKKSACYYVSSGISSVAYLSEKYTTTSYSQKIVQVVNMVGGVPNVSYQVETVAKSDQRTDPPLNTFDFAGRVNIMFGYEQHLSSKLFLHIEPYIKIPVSDLATQDLRFTTSGITCKISF
jgi:cytoskeletal protein RodZ